MEIQYKMTRKAWLDGYKIGLSRLSLSWCLLGLISPSLLISLLSLTFWGAAIWLPGNPFPWLALKHMSLIIGPCATGSVVAWYFDLAVDRLRKARTQVLQITPQHLLLGEIISQDFWLEEQRGSYRWRVNYRYRWKRMTALFVTDEYVCFCLGLPTAVLVPKVSFKSDEQLQAFVEQADLYWRRAIGRGEPPLESARIWYHTPPNSQEPDSNP